MNILFLCKNFYYNGGGERMLANLANELCDTHNITIVTLDSATEKSIFMLAKRIRFIQAGIPRRKINFFTKFDYRAYLLQNKNRLNEYDIIIGVGIICNLVLASVAHALTAKTIGWEHFSYNGTPVYQKVLRRFLFKRLDSVVVLTYQDLPKYRKITSHAQVIYNFTQMQRGSALADNLEQRQFLFVGRISKQKGIRHLEKIIRQFCLEHKAWHVKVIGKGPLQEHFLRFVAENGLQERVVYEPENDDIQSELAHSSCLLMTSLAEGLPMVLIEAQVCGVPAISFDTETGPGEIICNERSGFIIKRYDCGAFVKRMVQFATDTALQKDMQTNCLRACTRFLPDEKRKEWELLFQQLQECSA